MKNKVYSQYPWLGYDESCDVLVIGGGLTGAFCLYNLSQNGINAVMVTQKPVGFSSNCTQSISQYGNEIMLTEICKKHKKEEGVAYFKECEKALNEIEKLSNTFDGVNFQRRDSFFYSNIKSNVELIHSEYLMRRHNGLPVEFLDKVLTRNMFSFDVLGGILCENQAAELDDYALCHGLVKASEENGSRIFENTTATEIKITDDKYQVITGYGRKITANKIILCLGKGINNYIDEDAEIKTNFSIVTEQLEGFDGYTTRAIVKNFDKNITIHTTKDNSVIITGLDCSLLKSDSKIGKIIGVEKVIYRKYDELEQILQTMLVGINSLTPQYKYTTEYLKTTDLLPVATSLTSFNDIFLAGTNSVNGVIFSYIASERIVNQISKECKLTQNS